MSGLHKLFFGIGYFLTGTYLLATGFLVITGNVIDLSTSESGMGIVFLGVILAIVAVYLLLNKWLPFYDIPFLFVAFALSLMVSPVPTFSADGIGILLPGFWAEAWFWENPVNLIIVTPFWLWSSVFLFVLLLRLRLSSRSGSDSPSTQPS